MENKQRTRAPSIAEASLRHFGIWVLWYHSMRFNLIHSTCCFYIIWNHSIRSPSHPNPSAVPHLWIFSERSEPGLQDSEGGGWWWLQDIKITCGRFIILGFPHYSLCHYVLKVQLWLETPQANSIWKMSKQGDSAADFPSSEFPRFAGRGPVQALTSSPLWQLLVQGRSMKTTGT